MAGILLSCVLAPAQAGQPLPAACAAAAKHCPAKRAAPGLRRGSKQKPECGRLRTAILESEQSERRVRAAMMESVQQDLLVLRKRFRLLGCRAAVRT